MLICNPLISCKNVEEEKKKEEANIGNQRYAEQAQTPLLSGAVTAWPGRRSEPAEPMNGTAAPLQNPIPRPDRKLRFVQKGAHTTYCALRALNDVRCNCRSLLPNFL
uniref:Uncharacterized protein n=1 Tax=Anopheles merus TaxID=30066 RepID=A0A182V6V7_ANOME